MLESTFNKVTGLMDCSFIKRESPTQVFSCEFQNKCLRSLFYGTHTVTTSENG